MQDNSYIIYIYIYIYSTYTTKNTSSRNSMAKTKLIKANRSRSGTLLMSFSEPEQTVQIIQHQQTINNNYFQLIIMQ
jgi:hypothetical protein